MSKEQTNLEHSEDHINAAQQHELAAMYKHSKSLLIKQVELTDNNDEYEAWNAAYEVMSCLYEKASMEAMETTHIALNNDTADHAAGIIALLQCNNKNHGNIAEIHRKAAHEYINDDHGEPDDVILFISFHEMLEDAINGTLEDLNDVDAEMTKMSEEFKECGFTVEKEFDICDKEAWLKVHGVKPQMRALMIGPSETRVEVNIL